jgi:catechol 2,3-dioxygenase-like lactoylglutathione lyase family enzyme
MEQRLTLVTLGVRDLPRSVRFYESLGWTRSVRQAEGVAFFQAGGVVLSLYPRAALAKDADISAEGSGFAGITLAYNTRTKDEVDAVLDEAVAAGSTLVKSGYDIFWGGYIGFFADPDGFLWEVAWNPMFPLTEDGAVQLPD